MVIVQKTYRGTRSVIRGAGSLALVAIGFFVFFFSSSKNLPMFSNEASTPSIGSNVAYAETPVGDACGGDCGGCGDSGCGADGCG